MNNKSMRYKPYLFLLPSFILIAVFYYYAFVYAASVSLTDYRLGYKSEFIGLDNYIRLFTDKVFYRSIMNQGIILVADVIKNLTFPLLAAELLYFVRRKRMSEAVKKLFVFPMLVPGLVIFLMWVNIYSPSLGILNSLFDALGLDSWQHNWLNEKSTALGSVIFIGFPFVSGLYFLIFHSALNSIPLEISEAAVIDGCKSFQIFRHIHIPAVLPYIGTCTTLIIIGSMGDYVKILVSTKGGPNGFDTYVPALMLYNSAFKSGEMGYGASIGIVMFVIVLLISLATSRFSRSKETIQ